MNLTHLFVEWVLFTIPASIAWAANTRAGRLEDEVSRLSLRITMLENPED